MFDKLEWQRQHRLKTQNSDTKRYEKTPNGFLMRAYRNMRSRVEGVQWRKAHLYDGKPLLPRQEFYEWSKANANFWTLFQEWEKSGYNRRLSPSIDRIDPDKGYEIENMQWVPFYVNCVRTRRHGRSVD
jgi:hypothetical protein